MQKKARAAGGFTLIEAMITVAIIAIVAAVAYPSYTEHLRKSRRADAQALLMNVAQRQQQYLLDTRTYAATLAALNVTPPASVTPHYAVTLTVPGGTVPTFTVNAAPQGAQAADKCGTLSLDEAGIKSPGGCW